MTIDAISPRAQPAIAPERMRALVPFAIFLASLAMFEVLWGGRFYGSTTHVGHDFALTGIGLLEGRNWLAANGWLTGWFQPPWFTPAWCAGAAFYADPQSAFYSTLQLFALWLDPFQATHANSLLYATIAFWGGYLLVRRVGGWGVFGALTFGVLGMANASLPMRSIVGEPGFQPLYLWTLLALALCWPRGERPRIVWPAVGVALCLTGWLQAAYASMMVPAFLATLTLCMVFVMLGRADLYLVAVRAALGGFLSILLNASKLYEAISLMRNFPRDFYAIPGFPSISDALVSIALTLIQPSQWTAFFGRRLVNVQFTALPHEWSLQFGFGALALSLVAGLTWLLAPSRKHRTSASKLRWSPSKALAFVVICIIFVLPVMLLWNDGATRAIVKAIPVLNSTTWPTRWIVIYLPVAQFLLAWPVAALANLLSFRRGALMTFASMLVIWAGPATEPLDYYLSDRFQNYDPQPVRRAFELRDRGPIPITTVVVPDSDGLTASRNDTLLSGGSQAFCYNPIYGYRLEALPQPDRLRTGSVLDVDSNGQTLISNPACLVHPTENQCRPGDGFKSPAQLEAAKLFVARHPFEWQRPALGHYLSWLSQLSWIGLALILGFRMLARARRLLN